MSRPWAFRASSPHTSQVPDPSAVCAVVCDHACAPHHTRGIVFSLPLPHQKQRSAVRVRFGAFPPHLRAAPRSRSVSVPGAVPPFREAACVPWSPSPGPRARTPVWIVSGRRSEQCRTEATVGTCVCMASEARPLGKILDVESLGRNRNARFVWLNIAKFHFEFLLPRQVKHGLSWELLLAFVFSRVRLYVTFS